MEIVCWAKAMTTFYERFRPFSESVGALRFLTRLPVPFARTADLLPLRQTMRMFAIAGALIGAAQGAVFTGLTRAGVEGHVAAALACGLGLLITGALHEDGLADVADGFGGGKDRASRLAIMRDSRIGSYGTLVLLVAVLARLFVLVDLQHLAFWPLIAVTAAAGAFSRAMIVDLMWSTRPARSDGLSSMAGQPSRTTALTAILSGLALCLWPGLYLGSAAVLVGLAASVLSTAALRLTAIRLIDGQTGDVCGAVQVVSEIAMLVALATMAH
jgi:adenosylcobinamide-GDP ribazoletransferase